MVTHPQAETGRQSWRPTEVASQKDREKAFRVAARHSFFVRTLKVMLPVVAVSSMSLYFLSSDISVTVNGQQASIEAIELESDKLKMVNPRLEGFSDKNGAYVVSADAAYQSITDPETIELEKVVATVNNEKRGDARVTANNGVFFSKKEFLTLTGDVKITSGSGLSANLDVADVNMKTQTIQSKKPVAIEMNGSTINAREMLIQTEKNQIDFERDVVVKIVQPPAAAQDGTPTKPASRQSSLSALTVNRSEPIDVTASKLTVFDEKKLAKFVGSVTAVQGTYKMTSAELDVSYQGGGLEGTNQSTADIEKIEARHGVKVVAPNGRTATAELMIFHTAAETISMTGNVLLLQGRNTLKGNELFANLKTGKSVFKPGGRVYGHFINEAQAAKAKKQKPAAPVVTDNNAGDGNIAQFDFASAQGQPIDIVANTMTLDDVKKLVTFVGNVETTQGGYKINSDELKVHYSGDVGSRIAANSATDVSLIEAKKNVRIVTPDNQSAKADWATYKVRDEKIVVGGNVSLSRGGDVMTGQRMIVDLKTGRSHIEKSGTAKTSGNKERVRVLLTPGKYRKKKPDNSNGLSQPTN